jgi:hypothetical protein
VKAKIQKIVGFHKTATFKKGRFSRANLAVVVIIFVAIGSYILLSTHAATLPGDIDNDGTVGTTDLSYLASTFGQATSACMGAPQFTCDLNTDGKVDGLDFSVMVSHWGQTSSGGGTPSNTTQPYFAASTISNGNCTAGCAIQGQTLSVGTGTWSNTPTSYAYQWQDCTTALGASNGNDGNGNPTLLPPSTGSCANITSGSGCSATAFTCASSYTVQASDIGKALAVNVKATNAAGSTATVTTGSCNLGLMATSGSVTNGVAGCSPISAVAGATQAAEKFCSNAPTTCGFADIANAGVPAGTTLYRIPQDITGPTAQTGSGWSWSGSSISTDSNNAVIKNIKCTCTINVTTTGVTIQNSDISWNSSGDCCNWTISVRHANNTTITHNNLHGVGLLYPNDCDSGVRDIYSDAENLNITFNNMWWCTNPMNNITLGGLIANNYVHDTGDPNGLSDAHHEVLQTASPNGPNLLTVRDNTFYNSRTVETAAMITAGNPPQYPPENGRSFQHNLLAGGGYTFYGCGSASGTCTNFNFSNNRFARVFSPRSGGWGPTVDWMTGSTGNVWSNNIWDDSLAALSP